MPVERWNLLGPVTAMNGVLLFGWSTAVIFEILRRAIAVSTLVPSASDRRPARLNLSTVYPNPTPWWPSLLMQRDKGA